MTNKTLKENFLNPSAEFSPIPFWFWNGNLYEDELSRQIQDFYEKGVNGFVIHPRMGIPNDLVYMSDRFLDLILFAVKEADALGMKVVLYDEAMYPSGSAHGMVAKANPMFKSRGLRRAKNIDDLTFDENIVYEQDGTYYIECFTGGTIRGVHFGEDDGEEFAPVSSDLLNPDAVKLFISLTHDKYYDVLKEYFGNTIIGMFTDEPSLLGREAKKGVIPWSSGFADFYTEFGGSLSDIPKLWGDSPEYQLYNRALTACIEKNYYEPISKWCEKHGIALMGHPDKGDDIALLRHFHIPGQDLVFRLVSPERGLALEGAQSTQAKCSSDSARHSGKTRNSNECFGACNIDNVPWYFTGADMKWYIDWLCVRGVNMLIPHAFYYSIEGSRKFERPPDVGPNNIWWDDYKIISDYMKRLCWLMTDSVNNSKIAILCGVDNLDWKEAAKLFKNQIEFNYLEDIYIQPENFENGCIIVNGYRYDLLLIPENMEITNNIKKLIADNAVRVIRKADEAIILANRDIKCANQEDSLRFSHITKQQKDFYLFVNEGDEKIESVITIYKSGSCEFWNPLNGSIRKADIVEISNSSIKIRLRLEPRESIIVFLDSAAAPELHEKRFSLYSSSIVKNNSFTLTDDEACSTILLDLGESNEYTKLYMNDKEVGVRMWAPFTFDISGFVSAGENKFHVLTKECKAYEYGNLARTSNAVNIVTIYFIQTETL